MNRWRWVLVVAACLLPTTAWADQCAVVTDLQATWALLQLAPGSPGTQFFHLCEPCGQRMGFIPPNAIQRVRTASIVPDPSGGHSVVLNGDPIDLAYIFVLNRRSRTYFNLAALSHCQTQGVSRELAIGLPPGVQNPPPMSGSKSSRHHAQRGAR